MTPFMTARRSVRRLPPPGFAGGMNDSVQQQTQRVDENMPLLALDQLAGIEPVRINAGPPFSALFTL